MKEGVLVHQLSVALRLTDDAHSVPQYLPEHGLANCCQVNKIHGAASGFSNIGDERYLLLGSHGRIAQNSDVHITGASRRAFGNRAKKRRPT